MLQNTPHKKLCIIFVLTLLFFPLLTLAELPNTVFVLYDASTKEPVSEVLLKVDLNGESRQYYIEKGKDLILNLEQGDYDFKILANRVGTSGYDYYSSFSLAANDTPQLKVVYFYPAGSLYGTVKDPLDNVVSGAELNFECDEAFSVEEPKASDSFGSFSLDAVPAGKCQVSAAYGKSIGTASIEVTPGSKSEVEIKLDRSRITGKSWFKDNIFLIAGAVVILLVLGVLLYYFKGKLFGDDKSKKSEVYPLQKETSAKSESRTEETRSARFGQRGQDLIKTLRDNEKKIVLFLAEQEKPVHLSLIHYKTGLSKGSLSRNIDSLESKNIIETHMEGKVRKIKLSEWFLEG
ncbi:hypothetical protein HZC30_03140 [Candidatus Woesearchaeota archaeon]|nr:hypothetical protein [Candidatus Woesearchaeota archaeon]